jgi:hypothetical protein
VLLVALIASSFLPPVSGAALSSRVSAGALADSNAFWKWALAVAALVGLGICLRLTVVLGRRVRALYPQDQETSRPLAVDFPESAAGAQVANSASPLDDGSVEEGEGGRSRAPLTDSENVDPSEHPSRVSNDEGVLGPGAQSNPPLADRAVEQSPSEALHEDAVGQISGEPGVLAANIMGEGGGGNSPRANLVREHAGDPSAVLAAESLVEGGRGLRESTPPRARNIHGALDADTIGRGASEQLGAQEGDRESPRFHSRPKGALVSRDPLRAPGRDNKEVGPGEPLRRSLSAPLADDRQAA